MIPAAGNRDNVARGGFAVPKKKPRGPDPSWQARFRPTGPEVPWAFFLLLDVLLLAVAFNASYLLAPALKSGAMAGEWLPAAWISLLSPEPLGELRPLSEVSWVLLVMEMATILTLQAVGAYHAPTHQSRTRIILNTWFAAFAGLSAVALILFTFRSNSWSRLFVFMFALLGGLNLCIYRLVVRWYRAKRGAAGVYAKHLLLVAPPAEIELLSNYLSETSLRTDYVIEGYLRVDGHGSDRPMGAAGPSKMGTVEDLGALLVNRPIHEVIAVHGTENGDWLKSVIEHCDYFRITLRIVPAILLSGEMRELQLTYRSDPLRLPEIVLRPPNLDSEALFLKRVIDIVVSAVGLAVLAPMFVVVAIVIKLTTPGLPVFYRWRVVGYQGKPFTGYKFSTMVADAEQLRQGLASQNEMQGPVFKIKDDPRITWFGRTLRKYSINELPQLWSVLKGDMSLVGPRPAFPHELERYELWHKRKLCVRPGMTCLWQVRGRNQISNFDDWVRLDFEYIDNWSLWLDCRILARTAWAVVAGTGT